MTERNNLHHDYDVRLALDQVVNPKRRADAFAVLELMEEITGEPAVMWGAGVFGFGRHRHRYVDGREADWFNVGFSPRKQKLALYIMTGFDQYGDLLARLGKHKIGRWSLYINKLEDVDENVLCELIATAFQHLRSA